MHIIDLMLGHFDDLVVLRHHLDAWLAQVLQIVLGALDLVSDTEFCCEASPICFFETAHCLIAYTSLNAHSLLPRLLVVHLLQLHFVVFDNF